MNLFVPILAFGSVFALMIWLLLDPSSLMNIMQFAIPLSARSTPPRFPHLPVIVIFSTGVGFLYTLDLQGVIHFPHPTHVLQFYLLAIAAGFFGANGVWACYWPISFQRRYIPQLRHVSQDALSDETRQKLARFGKCWGVLFILLCSYLVYVTSGAV